LAGDIDGNDVIDQFDALTIGMNYNAAAPAAAACGARRRWDAGRGHRLRGAAVPAPGARLSPQTLVFEAQAHLPKFAVPRYVEIVPALPKTETNKVRKSVLRETPFTPGTWDRLQHVDATEATEGGRIRHV